MRPRFTLPPLTHALALAAMLVACDAGELAATGAFDAVGGTSQSADAGFGSASDDGAPDAGGTAGDPGTDASAPAEDVPDAERAEDVAAPPSPADADDAGTQAATGGCEPVGGALAGDPLVIPTQEGPVVGLLRDGLRNWRGIPYAAPPVGDLRFRAPAPALCRAAPHVAADFGPVCPQPAAYAETTGDVGAVTGDEDCLTLNVWAPTAEVCGDAGCPVLVYLHGGGHVGGGASVKLPGGGVVYDGAVLAGDHGIIVVTVQSRLGALGWLAHPALAAEQPEGPLGNYGLLDQQRALGWIQRNIGAFGGDTARVTLAGTSAGAVQTALHVAAPSSVGLFSQAVVMSGAATARTLEAALSDGERSIARTACASQAPDALLACLRRLPVEVIVQATHTPPTFTSPTLGPSGRLGPTLDGRLLTSDPLDLIGRRYASKNAAPPAILVGSNAEELAGLLAVTGVTVERWPEAVRALVAVPMAAASGLDVQRILAEILAMYPLARYATPDDALADVYTDLRFTCPARSLLAAASGPEARSWRYLFARRAATASGALPASHGREVVYFFGSWRNLPGYRPAEPDIRLSDAMAAALAGFVRDGVPDATPAWETWGEAGATLVLDTRVTLAEDPRAERCAMWDRLLGRGAEGE
jgi:para-nitrobenzyl esterase